MDPVLATLKWAASNGINIRVVAKDGVVGVQTTHGNIHAEFPITDGTAEAVGAAFFSAIDSIKTGTEFHHQHGFMPDVDALYDGASDGQG